LTAEHDLSGFDCGEPALNDWPRQRAPKNESRFSRIYAVCEGKRVAACVRISAGAVGRAPVPGRVRRNAPDTIPARRFYLRCAEFPDQDRERRWAQRNEGRSTCRHS
jgi:hypothetical protein